MSRCLILLLLLTLPFGLSAYETVPATDLQSLQNRIVFKLGFKARQTLSEAELDAHLATMQGSPLADYLRYHWLLRQLSKKELDVQRIERQRKALLNPLWQQRIARKWRKIALDKAQWQLALDITPAANDCAAWYAQSQIDGAVAFPAYSKALFAKSTSSRSFCAKVVSMLGKSDSAIPRAFWQARAESALANADLTRADEALMQLEDVDYLKRWRAAYQAPDRALEDDWILDQPRLVNKVVEQLLVQLAPSKPEMALKYWQNWQSVAGVDSGAIMKKIYPLFEVSEPKKWRDYNKAAEDLIGNAKRFRSVLQRYLRDRDYLAATEFLKAVDPKLDDAMLRYWRQRLAELNGEPVQWEHLLNDDGYYAWAAAWRGDVDYQPKWQATIADSALRQELEQSQGLIEVAELLAMGFPADARSLWRQQARQWNAKQKHAAAALAQRWGWHERAIATHGCKGLSGSVDLCYPRAFAGIAAPIARQYDLDLDWIYAVMRQESRFGWDLASSAGAQGLMQLMPNTAKWVAKRESIDFKPSSVLALETNIELGAGYLHWLQSKSPNLIEQAAGYNAGPGNLKKWRPSEAMARDLWIETISFSETRRYVKQVLANRLNYCVTSDQDCVLLRRSLFADAQP